MFKSFSVSGTSKEDNMLTGRSVDGELIKSGNHSSGSGDSSSSLLGEFKSADSELGEFK